MNGADWTYWLQMMNFAMAAVVVVAGLIVVIPMAWGLKDRLRKAAGALSVDQELMEMLTGEAHHLRVPELGLTMADGGEELKPSDQDADDEKQ